MIRLWLQVALFGGWGGHTSYNDLVAPEEIWHRFYSMGTVGVRFLIERRLQPGLGLELGRFISQDRRQARFSQTRWTSIGFSLRSRFLKKSLSPVLELYAFRLTATPRTVEDKSVPGAPASLSANGLGWAAGLSWRWSSMGEIALLYVRRRPQTNLLEGVPGPARDRIEGFLGQIAFYLLSTEPTRPRFR
ncbi:MAG: hypothetical protein N3E49_08350 [Bacteroidia bacterium]|nr:hypothetical protein [Bacteroidia bacterium]